MRCVCHRTEHCSFLSRVEDELLRGNSHSRKVVDTLAKLLHQTAYANGTLQDHAYLSVRTPAFPVGPASLRPDEVTRDQIGRADTVM